MPQRYGVSLIVWLANHNVWFCKYTPACRHSADITSREKNTGYY